MSIGVKTDGNKRKNTRHGCEVPVEGQKGSAFANSRTVDISQGGAGLVVSDYVPVNTKMAVEIDLEPQGEPILAVGLVKWVQQLSADIFRLGLCFTEVRNSPKSRIDKYFK